MPAGVTPGMVTKALSKSVSKVDFTKARQTGILFRYTLPEKCSRKSDNEALYLHKSLLAEIVKMSSTTVVHKSTILCGLNDYCNAVDLELTDPGADAYALKLMLMQLGRTKANMVTGPRLAP